MSNYKCINCTCGSHDHHLFVEGYKEEKELIFTINLKTGSFLERFKTSIKYLFGGKYQGFDEIILDKSSVNELQSVIDSLK